MHKGDKLMSESGNEGYHTKTTGLDVSWESQPHAGLTGSHKCVAKSHLHNGKPSNIPRRLVADGREEEQRAAETGGRSAPAHAGDASPRIGRESIRKVGNHRIRHGVPQPADSCRHRDNVEDSPDSSLRHGAGRELVDGRTGGRRAR